MNVSSTDKSTVQLPIPSRAILFLAVAAFAGGATARLCDPLLPLIAGEFRVTIGQTSGIVTAFALSYGLLQALFGPAGDRFGKYRVILWATLACIGASIACAFAPSLWALIVLRFVMGATAACVIPLAIAWIGDVVPYRERQAVLAKFMTGQISGLIFGQAAGGAMGEYFGWRTALASLSILFVIGGGGLMFELRTNPLTRQARVVTQGGVLASWRQMFALTRRPWVRAILTGVFLEGALMFGPLAFIGTSLHERFAIGLDHVGLIIALFGLGGLLYTQVVRSLIPRLGESGIAILGGAVLAAGYLLMATTPNLWLAGIGTALLGFGFYNLHSTLQTNASQMTPDARGSGMALFATCFFLGQSLGVWSVGQVVDRFGPLPAFWLAALVLPVLAYWFSRQLKLHAGMAQAI